MRARRSLLLLALPLALAGLLAPAASAAPPELKRCELGLKRALRCGEITVPMRRADPALGTTRVAFAVRTRGDTSRPALGTIMAMDGGPGYASTGAAFARSLFAVL